MHEEKKPFRCAICKKENACMFKGCACGECARDRAVLRPPSEELPVRPTLLLLVEVWAVLAGLTVLRGMCLSLLWGWFFVPLGAASLGLLGGIGVGIFGLALVKSPVAEEQAHKTSQKSLITILTDETAALGAATVAGYFAHLIGGWLL